MTNRFCNDLKEQCLWLLLLLASGASLGAQCEGPFNLACQTEINLTLNGDCQAEVTFAMVLTGETTCLADSNFTIVVEDDFRDNGGMADGPGRFRYTVVGRNHPELIGFDCWGFVNLSDQTPPVITGLDAGPIDRVCGGQAAADINRLPASVSRCYEVDGATGAILEGSLNNQLRAALLAGGGLPTVTDACGGTVEVCVNDVINAPLTESCGDTTRLMRTFTATQITDGESVAPAVSAQTILFLRPQLADLRGVEEVTIIDCLEGDEIGVNPLPQRTDFPFFVSNSGPLYLNENVCDFVVDYVDGERISGCGKNYAFVRTFRLLDWCSGGVDTTFSQVVRVGDREAPVISPPVQDNDFDGMPDPGPLRFPTNTGECTAIINVRGNGVSIEDGCSDSPVLTAVVFLNEELDNFPLGPFGNNAIDIFTTPIPVGTHLLRYLGRDACGNTGTLDVIIEVYDGVGPAMVCEDGFNVSLDGNGLGVLPAAVLDGGTRDGCGAFNLLVSRVDENDAPTTAPAPQLVLSCEDIGEVRVMLEGTDNSPVQNSNRCWMTITVEDKAEPVCIPPPTVRISCLDFSAQLPKDLAIAYAMDPETIGPRLDAAFGTATGRDNCPETTTAQSIGGELGDCGTGRFTRLFRIRDGGGFTHQNPCRQVVDILPYNEYTVRFPGDQRYTCRELPTPEDLLAVESGCELLTVNTSVDTLVADESACYKLRLNHEIINWCEYDGNSRAFLIPRDADGDGNLAQAVYLHIEAGDGATLTDDQAIIDQDATPGNGNDLGALISDYGSSTRRGFFRYQQFVTVHDDEAPTLNIPEPDAGSAFTEDCLGGVILEFTATDDCGTSHTTVSVDTDVWDRNGDGNITGADFVADREIATTFFEGEPETGVEVFIRRLSIGDHLARVMSSDGCGNSTVRFVPLTVKDDKAPTPSCIGALSTTLAADPDNGGIGIVWATDYIASPASICTPSEITYAIYREEEAAVPGFTPQSDQSNLTVSCVDIGEVLLRVYAFAESNGQNGFCNVSLNVRTNNEICEDRNGIIAGVIQTERGEAMEGVDVYNDGHSTTQRQQTNENGNFLFNGLEESQDYTIQPLLNANPINGVSTLDINLIARRLLGVDDGLSPYQLIAADVNNNGQITIRDLIMIREVILGLEEDFANNNSWRFIPKDYDFPDPTNPWLERFPEVANFNNLEGQEFVEFIAIKVGDVNGNALPHNSNALPPGTGSGNMATLEWQQDEQTEAWALYAGAEEGMRAMQFSLALPAKTFVRPGLISAAEYTYDEQGHLHVSYAPDPLSDIPANRPLLTLSSPELSEAPDFLQAPGALAAEVYFEDLSTRPLGMLQMGEDRPSATASLFPNPSRAATRLSFDWPRAEVLTLSVHDLAGRELRRQRLTATQGHNQLTLTADAFGAAGVYLLRLEGDAGQTVVLRAVRE
ncbi:T9SS type A sorting domain-containing protein [Neolewinella agarilytica]|uniref:T9SS type A sorting domain-containing protein n=1 Tax=Neolewinella agarilytica TaxID=478744 RepID=UPI0023551C46|nr:T9SS type A sorting domain-containing protein [Neolewinella agarilytica]